MPDFLNDQALIAGCLDRQKKSWDAFVDRFSKLIFWSIRRTLENSSYRRREELVQEIFQDFFVTLFQRSELEKLRSVDSLRKFLIVKACHLTMDKVKGLSRHEKRSVVSLSEEDLSEDVLNQLNAGLVLEDVAKQSVLKEKSAVIESALKDLSPKERACVEWHYFDGKSHKEIAEVLGVPQDTVSTVIRRTREKLKKVFLEKGLLE